VRLPKHPAAAAGVARHALRIRQPQRQLRQRQRHLQSVDLSFAGFTLKTTGNIVRSPEGHAAGCGDARLPPRVRQPQRQQLAGQ